MAKRVSSIYGNALFELAAEENKSFSVDVFRIVVCQHHGVSRRIQKFFKKMNLISNLLFFSFLECFRTAIATKMQLITNF